MERVLKDGISVSANLGRIVRNKRGQGLVEYSLILLLVAIVVFIMVRGIGTTTNNSFSKVNSAFTAGS